MPHCHLSILIVLPLLLANPGLHNREWTWANDNVVALSKELNATDAEYFNFRLHNLDWREYWLNYFIALRTHYFKVQGGASGRAVWLG